MVRLITKDWLKWHFFFFSFKISVDYKNYSTPNTVLDIFTVKNLYLVRWQHTFQERDRERCTLYIQSYRTINTKRLDDTYKIDESDSENSFCTILVGNNKESCKKIQRQLWRKLQSSGIKPHIYVRVTIIEDDQIKKLVVHN